MYNSPNLTLFRQWIIQDYQSYNIKNKNLWIIKVSNDHRNYIKRWRNQYISILTNYSNYAIMQCLLLR